MAKILETGVDFGEQEIISVHSEASNLTTHNAQSYPHRLGEWTNIVTNIIKCIKGLRDRCTK